MNWNAAATSILLALQPLILPAIAVAAATAAACILLIPFCRRTWLNKTSFSWLGVFYRQRTTGYIRIACSWIKLVLLVTYLVRFQVLEASQYILFLVPGLLTAALSRRFNNFLNRVMWIALQGVGLLAANTICGFILEMAPTREFTIIYILLSVFLGLFGSYLFLMELHTISGERGRNIGEERSLGFRLGAIKRQQP